jgi:hypothetical protein
MTMVLLVLWAVVVWCAGAAALLLVSALLTLLSIGAAVSLRRLLRRFAK